MLRIPELNPVATLFPVEPANVYRILSIDPGGYKTGVSRIDIDIRTGKILSIRSWTIFVDRLKNDTGIPEELLSEKFFRFYKLRNEILRILQRENVHYVAYEGPFMNRLQPSAYGPLVAVMTLIMDALIAYNPGIPFFVLQPQQTKKAVGVAGKKGKDVVKEAVRGIPVLMDALAEGNCLLDDLDDNAVDSIAVGYCALKLDILPGVPHVHH